MLRIAVCDDIPDVVTQVNGYLSEYAQHNNCELDAKSFYNAEDLWEHLKSNHCDLIILDIELVKMNGVELGHLIREKLNDHAVNIIYISAMDTYDRQLFDVQPLNFLPKPIEKEKLYNTINLAIQLMDDRNHVFTFKNKNGSHRVRIKDILYFESSAHNFIIVTVNERYEFRAGLSDIMSELSGYGFIQVHRSYIVNYDRIRTIKYEELIMENGYAIPISRNKRKEIRDTLIKFGGSRL